MNTKNKIDEDDDGEKCTQVENIYSIEQFNNLMRRVKLIEDKEKYGGKINWVSHKN